LLVIFLRPPLFPDLGDGLTSQIEDRFLVPGASFPRPLAGVLLVPCIIFFACGPSGDQFLTLVFFFARAFA